MTLEEDLSLIVRTFLVGLAASLLAGCDRQSAPAPQDGAATNAAAAQPVAGAGLDRSKRGQAMPDTVFKDAEGEDVTLSEFRGSPLLVNLWATWCAPCVKELPTLDRLAAGKGVRVIAISQDSAAQDKVRAFLA
jgi:thiol-disulfide isomerase/thioredoxin